jgi:hypothetical protein
MEQTLALPLTIGRNGAFVRQDRSDAIVAVIGVMASTPAGFWPHAPWFGFREALEASRAQVEQVSGADDAIREALRHLGVTGITVTIRRVELDDDVHEFAIQVQEEGQVPQVRHIPG